MFVIVYVHSSTVGKIRGGVTADFLQDKIDKLESQLQGNNIADEYIGVRLYLYKRKAEKLRKQR